MWVGLSHIIVAFPGHIDLTFGCCINLASLDVLPEFMNDALIWRGDRGSGPTPIPCKIIKL